MISHMVLGGTVVSVLLQGDEFPPRVIAVLALTDGVDSFQLCSALGTSLSDVLPDCQRATTGVFSKMGCR